MGIDEQKVESIKSEFPIRSGNFIYLAHCLWGPPNRKTQTAVCNAVMSTPTSVATMPFVGLYKEREIARQRAAQLIDCKPQEIALTNSTVTGINIVANGLKWSAGDNIVVADVEFPANVYPWKRLETLGVEIRYARSGSLGRVTPEAIFSVCDKKTKVVSLSLVQFGNGFRLDHNAIGEYCQKNSILFFLDAVQALGCLDIKVSDIPVDFMSAGGYKWLMGPAGTGVFYCREDLIDRIETTFVGHHSMDVEPDTLNSNRNYSEFYPYEYKQKESAGRFEPGSPNLIGLSGLSACLEQFVELGPKNIQGRIFCLREKLIDGLLQKGYKLATPNENESEISGIVSFYSSEVSHNQINSILNGQNIFVSPHWCWIRVAPHYYNSLGDIENLLHALPNNV